MKSLEKIKAKIEFFKTLFLVFVAALFSVVGYLFSKLEDLTQFKFFILVYVIIVLCSLVFVFLFGWLTNISKLGEDDARDGR